jgi:hypothetical protein
MHGAEHDDERRFTRRQAIAKGASAAGAAGLVGIAGTGVSFAREQDEERAPALDGRVVASGIAGASAVSSVGVFLPGGPIHDNPALAAFTQPGRVLDPARILVAGRSNFGAPKANRDQAEGALLSIDPAARDLAVPRAFARSGDQASALGGAVQLYCAQSAAWRNGFYNPAAVTAGQTAVSNPLGLSINNAFGRLWPVNAPYGLDGPGSSTIDDPDGRPLQGAPNPRTGGAYFGDITGRQPAQIIPGALAKGAVATAFLGRSPDTPARRSTGWRRPAPSSRWPVACAAARTVAAAASASTDRRRGWARSSTTRPPSSSTSASRCTTRSWRSVSRSAARRATRSSSCGPHG